MGYNCSIPAAPLIGSARIFYTASCTILIIASFALQAIFAATCQRMKGWKSDFAFYLLQIMALFSLLSYAGLFISYMHGLILFDSPLLSKLTGANYQGSYFCFIITNSLLTAHRLIYTLFPLRAQNLLSATFEKVCISSIFAFYFVYFIITMTPLASVVFCEAHFFFYFERRPLYPLMSMMNQVSNYMVGVVNVVAYFIMFTVLFIKGTLTFKKNSEIRMTIQAAVVSVFELTFFLYWEYGPSSALPQFWMRTLNSYSMLIYYDVLILPYVVLNKTVKTEMKGIFHGRSSIAAPIVKFSSDHGKAFQRRSL